MKPFPKAALLRCFVHLQILEFGCAACDRTVHGNAVQMAQATCSTEALVKNGRDILQSLIQLSQQLGGAAQHHSKVPGISMKPYAQAREMLHAIPTDLEAGSEMLAMRCVACRRRASTATLRGRRRSKAERQSK